MLNAECGDYVVAFENILAMTTFLIYVFGINIRIIVINLNAANFHLNFSISNLLFFFFELIRIIRTIIKLHARSFICRI